MPFQTSKQAQIAKRSLEPDPILKPSDLRVEYSTDSSTLVLDFQAVSARILRVAVSSVLDSLKTVVETLDEFEGVKDEYLGN